MKIKFLPFLLLLALCTSMSAQNQMVSIRATDPVAVEKNSTTVSDGAQFEISRAGSAAGDLVVGITVGGNAVLATDFTVTPAGATTSVTIPAGKASVVVAVTPVDNSTQQDERTLTLTVAPGVGYAVGAEASASVRLLDMDKAGSSTFTGNADLFYSYKVYTTTYASQTAKIAIPTYRGVEVPVVRVAADGVYPQWMARWAYDNGVAFYSANTWNKTLDFLPVLASASSHPEVANAMIIGIGTSSGATGACQMADKNTSRSVYVMGITEASAKYSPSLTTHAEFDDAYKFHHGEGRAAPFGGINISENRLRHTYCYDLGEQKVFFYDKFIKLRTDYQPGIAGRDPVLGPLVGREIDYSKGYIGEARFGSEFFNYATWEAHTIPVADYNKVTGNDAVNGSWLPDAATAAAWRAFTNRGENHCLWDFPQLGVKDDMASNNTMVCMVNTAQTQPCIVDTGLFADADLCEFYDNETLVATDRSVRTDADGYRVFDHSYGWDASRLGARVLHAVLVNSTTGKRVQVAPTRVVYVVPHENGHNTAPTITPVPAMTVDAPATTTTIDIPFTVGDAEVSPESLLVKFGAPDEAMMSYTAADFTSTITGTGANRTLSITLDPATVNKGGVIGGILMVGDGELSANAYVTIKIRKPGAAPFFHSIQSIGSMSFVSNEVGYDENAPAGDGMSMCVVVNGWSKEWSITVRDWDTDPRKLTLTAVSNTPATLPTENIVLGGYGPYRTIQVRPIAYGTQDTSLTLYLSDGASQVTRTYKFRIVENQDNYEQNDDYKNTAPHIGCIPDQTVYSGEQSPRVYFQIADYHTASEDLGVGNARLKVSTFSDNEEIVPNSAIFVGDPGQARWITLRPPAGVSGSANVTVTVTDEAGLNASSNFKVTVGKVAPFLDSDVAGTETLAAGGSKTFGVSARGGELSYQWYLGASGDTSHPIGGATGPTLDTGALSQSGQYWCRVSNSLGHSDSATQTVNVIAEPPTITAHPQGKTANEADPVRFSVTATGDGLSYQWFAGASGNTTAPVAGATSDALTVSAVNGASYWCRVSNLAGTVDSAAAVVTTVGWYAFHDMYSTSQISDGNHANVSEGSASGTAYFLRNFANNATLGTPTITFTDNGTRTALTTGANPSPGTDAHALFNGRIGVGAKSDKMTSPSNCRILFSGLTPGRKYSVAFYACRNNFTNQSQFTIENAGGYVAASSAGVTLGGTNGNTTAVVEAGATADTDGRVVRWDNITPSGAGGTSFSVLVNKSPLAGASNDFILPQATMLHEYAASTPVLLSATSSVSVAPGGQATFHVEAGGAGLTYQWYRGNSGDTSNPITWDASSGTYTTEPLAAGASYWVRISSSGTSVDSATLTAAIDPALLAPRIVDQPADVSCDETNPATFTVNAASATGYQWLKNGEAIPGATSATYEIAASALDSAGSYDCVVSNASGSVTTRTAKLSVRPGRPPVIVFQPNAWHYRFTDEGSVINSTYGTSNYMNCFASGTGPLTFQWRKDGVPIPDAGDLYLYDQATFESRIWFSSDSGVYDCVVSNAFGSVVSDSLVGVVNYSDTLHAGGKAGCLTAPSPDSGTPKWIDVVSGGSVTLDFVIRGGSGTLVFGERNGYYGGNFTQLDELTTATNPNHYYHYSHTIPNVGTNPNGYASDSNLQPSYEFLVTGDGKNYSRATLSFKNPTAPDSIVASVYNYIGATFVPVYYYMSKNLAVGEPTFAVAMTSAGTAPFTYQWYKDGVAIPGATKAVYIDNDMQPADSGAYHVVVTNSVGSYTAYAINWTVSPERFFISSQPQNTTVAVGSPASLAVATTGATPTSYQWKRNNVEIPGATEATYTVPSTTPQDAGRYTCVVERTWPVWDEEFQEWYDDLDIETSSPADIVVIAPPTIADQPLSQTATPGQTVTFRVSAVGSLDFSQADLSGPDVDFTYQWRKNGVAIDGAIFTSLTIASAAESDEGSYDCMVTSTVGAGSVTSTAATLTVLPSAPTFVSQSEGVAVNQGEGTTISVTATGSSLTYQWYRGALGDMSNPVIGATGTSLATGVLSTSSLFWVQIANAGGSVSSRAISVDVTPPTPPTIMSQPVGTVLPIGGSTTLSVSARGTSPFSYQWKKNGTTIVGATSATLALTNVISADTGTYTCTVTNLYGSILSVPATVVVSGAPIITTHPADAVIAKGQSAVLTVVATGAPLSYQWYEGTSGSISTPVSGATTASLTTPALQSTASYWCRVSNAYGTADSNTATVRLPNWEAYHDTIELADNGGTNATQNAVPLTAAPTTSVPVVTTLKDFATGGETGNRTLTQSRTIAAPSVASNNGGVVAPAPGTDAYKVFGGKIVVGQKTYQIAGGSTYTFAFSGLDSSKRYAVAFFASRDDSRYTVKTKLTLLGASGWTNASSAGTTAIAGTNNATVEVDVSAGSAAAGRVIRWNDISIAGSTFSVRAEMGSSGTSFVVPQCVALIEYEVPTQVAAPEITTQPVGAIISDGGSHTLSVSASGTGVSYQWFQGMTGDTTLPVTGATAASFTTPALSATVSYWVRVSNSSGSRLSSTATVTIAPPPQTPLESWASGYSLSGSSAVPAADPDGDGLSNLIEFALGGNPSVPGPSSLPVVDMPTASTLGFTFHRARSDVRYIVESSTTLAPGSWTTEYTIEKGSDPSSIGRDVTVEAPLNGATKKFFRLRVEE